MLRPAGVTVTVEIFLLLPAAESSGILHIFQHLISTRNDHLIATKLWNLFDKGTVHNPYKCQKDILISSK